MKQAPPPCGRAAKELSDMIYMLISAISNHVNSCKSCLFSLCFATLINRESIHKHAAVYFDRFAGEIAGRL